METNKKDRILVLSNFIIAYSTFVGVLSAMIYYIADIKGISILIAQAIGTIYIVVAIISFYWLEYLLDRGGEK